MKTIQFKAILFSAITAMFLSGCTKDSDAEVPTAKKILFAENFDNADLTVTGWMKHAEVGNKVFTRGVYKNDGYAVFTTYGGASEPVTVTWLISPPINMDTQTGETLYFQTAQDGFVRNIDNSLELYVSTDYDGVNFASAGWEKIPFNVATQNDTRYIYKDSGFIDLSKYTGTLYFAFKGKGTTSQSGGYQIDNVRIFY